jgi:hypothetical protein
VTENRVAVYLDPYTQYEFKEIMLSVTIEYKGIFEKEVKEIRDKKGKDVRRERERERRRKKEGAREKGEWGRE